MLETMLRKFFRQIQQDYGLILIAHDGRKQDADDDKVYYASLNFNRKVKRVVMGLLDILAYVETKRGSANSIMHFRDSEMWEAKSRFKNIPEAAEFSYEGLVDAVSKAVGEDSTSERKSVRYSEALEMPTNEQFEGYFKFINEKAMDVVKKTNKTEEVQAAISRALNGRKLSTAVIEDYYALKEFEDDLKEIEGN